MNTHECFARVDERMKVSLSDRDGGIRNLQ